VNCRPQFKNDSIFQVEEIKCLDNSYYPSCSFNEIENTDDSDNDFDLYKPGPSMSYSNILRRAPINAYKDYNTIFEDDDISLLDNKILTNKVLNKELLTNKQKRKFEVEPEQKSSKRLKLWNLIKYPYQKMIYGTLRSEDESNISISEIINQIQNSLESDFETDEENNSEASEEVEDTSIKIQNSLESDFETDEENNSEASEEVEDTSINVNTRTFCNIV